MERISYDEAREWFWVRTWMWFVACALLSVIATFAYSGELLKTFPARFWVSVIAGISVRRSGCWRHSYRCSFRGCAPAGGSVSH